MHRFGRRRHMGCIWGVLSLEINGVSVMNLFYHAVKTRIGLRHFTAWGKWQGGHPPTACRTWTDWQLNLISTLVMGECRLAFARQGWSVGVQKRRELRETGLVERSQGRRESKSVFSILKSNSAIQTHDPLIWESLDLVDPGLSWAQLGLHWHKSLAMAEAEIHWYKPFILAWPAEFKSA